ncbi:hypothetical protein [Curtobacterium sp. MCBD17_040]|uniref:hypothetical protein n=1 Tax=Curtobacterium sp. MCBD17_040 TaxID=2175674 RepID=UPI000DA93F4F|nr:hypothetical protein [Curtobacterium sp. MCBD17_040]WIB65441.1 hypothetical protein DEI94_18750 [Curtobacterium sp. MCBD17_040]
MTAFIESDHPRARSGKFAEKTFTGDAVTLERAGTTMVNTDKHGIVALERVHEGQRVTVRVHTYDDTRTFRGTVDAADGEFVTIDADGTGARITASRTASGTWFTEDGDRLRAFTERELPLADWNDPAADAPSRNLRKGETYDPTPWEFQDGPLAGQRFATSFPAVQFYTPPKWKPRDSGVSAVAKDALEFADKYGRGRVYVVDGHRSGHAMIGDDAYCYNQETVDSLVRRGLLEEDLDGDSVTVRRGDCTLYRLTRPEK